MARARERICIGLGCPAVLACAPLLGFRPASGVQQGRAGEVGVGAVALTPRPVVDEPVRFMGQTWAAADASRTVAVSVLGAFDADAVGLGLAVRFHALRRDRLALAIEAELGFPWVALSVPVSVRTSDATWLYSAPRFGHFGVDPLVTLPAGVSVHAGEGVFLRAEGAALLHDLTASGLRWAGGPAVAYQPDPPAAPTHRPRPTDRAKTATTGR